MKNEKTYYFCDRCGNVVCRIIGVRHGDGQIDTDKNPLYLLEGSIDNCIANGWTQKEIDDLKNVHCGC